MPRVLELLRWKLQVLFAWKPTRAQVLPLILGVYALAGWGAYANKASANRDLATQVTLLQTERNKLVGRQKALEQANIDLGREWQGKLASAREELGQALAARDAAKSQLAGSQRELTASKKRLDQTRDRVTETGSIKPAEPSKKAAGKP
jgi:chromosome segregation ATPase